MSQELIYTSAPRGLKPGSRGFCTVLSTQAMSAPLAAALESLSGYRAVFPPGDPRVSDNPVVFSHVHLAVAGKSYSVLSRISDYGLDYSQRANKIAHHLVLGRKEQVSGGPAAVLGQPGIMESTWSGKPCVIPTGRNVTAADVPLAPCRAWQQATGDAGWAGVLAESFQADPGRHAYLVVAPGMDVLPLIAEAIHLLPEALRWNVTFSTYFTSLPPGTTCQWRCVLAGSPEAQQSRRFVQALRIDLTQPMPKATGGALVEQARTGRIAPPTNVAIASSPSSTHPPIENPATSDSPPMVPLDGGNRAARPSSGGPPPPPRKRTRTLADVPDVPRRRWVVPAMLAALVFLMLGAAGAGFYLWRPGDGLGREVAAAGTDAKAIESQQAPAPPKATKTPTSTESSQEHSEKSVAQGDIMPPPIAPIGELASADHGAPDAKDASAPPAKPMNPDNTSQEPSNKDDEPLAEEALEEPTQSGPILHWVSLPNPDGSTSKKNEDLLLVPRQSNSTEMSMTILLPDAFANDLKGTVSKGDAPRLTIEFQLSGTWATLAHFTSQPRPDGHLLQFQWGQRADEFRRKLAWCGIRIGEDPPQYVILRQQPSQLDNIFSAGSIKWKTNAELMHNFVSNLDFGADVSLQADNTLLDFSTHGNRESRTASPRSLIIHSHEAASLIFQSVDVSLPQNSSHQFGLRVDVGREDDLIEASFVDKEKLFSEIRSCFDNIECDPARQTLKRSDQWIRPMDPDFAQFPRINFASFTNDPEAIVHKVREWVQEWERFGKKLKAKMDDSDKTTKQIESYDQHHEQLKALVDDSPGNGLIDNLMQKAIKIQSLEKSFDTATITSARIYYIATNPSDAEENLEIPIVEIPPVPSPAE